MTSNIARSVVRDAGLCPTTDEVPGAVDDLGGR